MTYYHRTLQDDIMANIDSAEAVFILGPRQSGKTTLLKHLMLMVGEDNSLFFDIEYPQNLSLFNQSIDTVLQTLRNKKSSDSGKKYIFLDEVQYLSDFSKTIKLLVDHYSDEFKLVMTGSSSVMIKQQFKESLVGRKLIYELYPLSFLEFCGFKGEKEIVSLLHLDSAKDALQGMIYYQPKVELLLQEYFVYGGYPKVVLANNTNDKIKILQDIASSYILKDIKNLFHIGKIDNLNHLVRHLSVNIGKEININSLSTETGLYRETVDNYLNILEASYIIKRLTPYHTNLSTELKKMPKSYYVDTGIRNVLINNFNDLEQRTDKGELFENYVFLNLYHHKDILTQLKFWKTRNMQEIDFILVNANALLAYECKYGLDNQNSFTAFKNQYPQAECRFIRFKYSPKAENEIPAWLI
jgi:predicted AAA+ superfamily ATPase